MQIVYFEYRQFCLEANGVNMGKWRWGYQGKLKTTTTQIILASKHLKKTLSIPGRLKDSHRVREHS